MDSSQYKNVWVFAEQRQGVITSVVKELLDERRELARNIGTDVCAVLLGKDVDCLARELIRHGADKVYVADHPFSENFIADVYTKVITDVIGIYRSEIVLHGVTHIDRDPAPRIAAKANTDLTADCTGLSIDPQDKKVMQTRPAFDGNLMATIICPEHRPQISTVRPGVMQKLEPDDSRQGEIIDVDIKLEASGIRARVPEIVKGVKEMVSLTDADVIVFGGHGLGNAEGFAVIKKLADTMGGMVGVSRAAMGAEWIDHSHQAGQTGTAVKPKLYVTCGISGAIQCLVGMQPSDIIIAINKNSRAPIFEVADYSLVGNLYEVVPMMAEAFVSEKII